MLTDYHIHSRQSCDAGDSMMSFVREAEKTDFAEICFTDHVDFSPAVKWYDYFNWDTYKSEITEARENSEKVVIRSGLEIDYQIAYEDQARDFLNGREIDFAIGSVHYVNDKLTMVDSHFKTHGEFKGYELHFDEVLSAAKSGLFDVLGHIDYAKRAGVYLYGSFNFEDFKDHIAGILEAAIKTDTGIEVNAAGFSHPPDEPYPGLKVLKLYHELGGRIMTFGSDSHNSPLIGANIKKARDLAKEAGFTEFTVFEKRKPLFVPL